MPVVGMRAFSSLFTSALVVLLALSAIPGGAAQTSSETVCDDPNIGCCGDLTLILLNPDLQPRNDGFIHASGNFFVQFQAIGEQADQIETFGFSFGAYTAQVPEDVCDAPPEAWFTGQQLINYRADTNPDDGFFINLQTPLVPDNQYTAAVHAYDGDDNELARFWASAIVENCDTPTVPNTPVERCDGDTEQTTRNDFTQPWPIVLPGDGLTPSDVDGFTIEFAEPLSDLGVYLNGDDVTDQLEEWEGREWDDDLIPGYGPQGLGAILVPECSQQPPQECSTLGEAYKWTQRTLTEADVIRVEATDMAGNVATKDIHVGSGVTSGAITENIPILTWSVDQARIEVGAGDTAVFGFTIQNSGGAQGHPFADQTLPEGWDFEWQPVHVPVDPGTTEEQEFLVTPPAGTAPGAYPVTALMNYTQSGETKTLTQQLTVTVSEGGLAGDGNQTAEPQQEAEKDTPAPALVLLLPALGAAVALRRRR